MKIFLAACVNVTTYFYYLHGYISIAGLFSSFFLCLVGKLVF